MHPTLLIVDDEPPIRDVLRRALRLSPYAILEAGSGEEALAVLEGRQVDLILSDLNMPGMSGLDLCRRVVGEQPGVVCFLMTGQGDRRQALQAIEEGTIFHYVPKPWDLGDLSLLLGTGLRHRELYREKERLLALVRTQRRIIAELEAGTSTAGEG